MEKIEIKVYSGINAGGGGCSCGCSSCTPADFKTEYEMMRNALLQKYGPQDLSMEFIDTEGKDLAEYPQVQKVIQSGYSFPITVVNGSPRLAGAIPADALIEIIDELNK